MISPSHRRIRSFVESSAESRARAQRPSRSASSSGCPMCPADIFSRILHRSVSLQPTRPIRLRACRNRRFRQRSERASAQRGRTPQRRYRRSEEPGRALQSSSTIALPASHGHLTRRGLQCRSSEGRRGRRSRTLRFRGSRLLRPSPLLPPSSKHLGPVGLGLPRKGHRGFREID